MKFATLATLVTMTAGLAAAASHRHGHARHHQMKREVSPVASAASPESTVVIYELNGQQISSTDVQDGIANGTLVWASSPDAGVVSHDVKITNVKEAKPVTTPSPSAIPSPSMSLKDTKHDVVNMPAAPAHAVTPIHNNGNSNTGVNTPFPDGQLSCSDFPSAYGAIPLDYLNVGGWAGVQKPGSAVGGFSDIMTMTSGQCSGSDCCSEGSFCSYACPAGYQKSQWPSTQGATGQSIGGLQCKDGKLWLTNPSLSKNICMPGAEQVQVRIHNTMNEIASLCRTDYPGTESETIPLGVSPNQVEAVTCPDGDNYYTWLGKTTSAQYYLNPAGVAPSVACQWGSPGDDWGNYAPMNIGVGYSNGAAWLSMFPNAPTTLSKLAYAVEIIGDNMSGKCKYENGQYWSGENYETSSPTGCTVSVSSGMATFVLS